VCVDLDWEEVYYSIVLLVGGLIGVQYMRPVDL
jgi:hypothetical protein